MVDGQCPACLQGAEGYGSHTWIRWHRHCRQDVEDVTAVDGPGHIFVLGLYKISGLHQLAQRVQSQP